MSILSNITVETATLQAIKKDIADYLFSQESQTDFSDQITQAKRIVYRDIKADYKRKNPLYSDAELETDLDTVKDYPSAPLQEKVAYHSLALIMFANEDEILGAYYKSIAESVPAEYYTDIDADSIIDTDEEGIAPRATLGR